MLIYFRSLFTNLRCWRSWVKKCVAKIQNQTGLSYGRYADCYPCIEGTLTVVRFDLCWLHRPSPNFGETHNSKRCVVCRHPSPVCVGLRRQTFQNILAILHVILEDFALIKRSSIDKSMRECIGALWLRAALHRRKTKFWKIKIKYFPDPPFA